MKQTIAELGIGGEGWIIYRDSILSKRVIHINVVNNWTDDVEYKMPRFLLRELLEFNGVKTTQDLIVFASQIVYSTKEEADEELEKEISHDAATHFYESEQLGKEISALTQPTSKVGDWEQMLSELYSIQKEFNEVTEREKEDASTFIKKLKNIANPQQNKQQDNTDWNQVRIDISTKILNALVTKYGVRSSLQKRDSDIKFAIDYADALIEKLKRSKALFEEKLKEI